MGKQIIAVLVGVVVGIAVTAIVVTISSNLYPMPQALDRTDPEAMRQFVFEQPITAKLLMLIGWMVSAFAAGLAAALLAPEGKGRTMAIYAGAILMAFGVANAFMVPHPMWMLIIGLLQYIPLAHLGAKAAGK